MAYKIDIRIIVKDHLKTLVNDADGKPDWRDYLFFLIIPLIIPAFLVYYDIRIEKDFINSMISGLSIYVGLSLNLIMLLFEIVQKKDTSNFKKDVAKELTANLSFNVLLSILAIIFSVVTLFDKYHCLRLISNYTTFFILVQMFFLLLLILKRMYYQLIDQIKSN